MKALLLVLKEHYYNKYMINRLALYELKNSYTGTFLGTIWLLLNPLIQISVYWLVFGLGIRGGAPVNGVPFFVWLICGLIPWFFINTAITKGSNAIYSRLGTISKMNFPLSIVPTLVVFAQLYSHMILLIILFIVVIAYTGLVNISIIGLVFFVILTTFFLIALSFVTSTVSTMVRDIHILIQSIVRMLFFLTPILWTPSEDLPLFFKVIIQLNPFYYVVEGYRAALLWGDMSIVFSTQALYFYNFTVVLLFLGTALHVKFRKQFVDYI
jgi:teichoic acid transport system permease protein